MAEEQPPLASGEEKKDSPVTEQSTAEAVQSAPEQAVERSASAVTVEPISGDEQKAIDELLKQATFEDPQAVAQNLPPTANLDLPNFSQAAQEAQASSIDLLRDVDLNVKIELGRSRMLVEDVLKLGEGSVVELDKLAGDPVDVFVNERLVARGEVLVLNDNFCVRINEIVAGVKEEGL
jgi:flagellar motor switch protein FliN/FliY